MSAQVRSEVHCTICYEVEQDMQVRLIVKPKLAVVVIVFSCVPTSCLNVNWDGLKRQQPSK